MAGRTVKISRNGRKPVMGGCRPPSDETRPNIKSATIHMKLIREVINQSDLEQLSKVLPEVTPQVEIVPGILSPTPQHVQVVYLNVMQWGRWERCKEAQKTQARQALVAHYQTQHRMRHRIS
jgi:hypothetical protein